MTRVHDVIEFVKERFSNRGESLKVHGVISTEVHYNDDQTDVINVDYGVEFSDETGEYEVHVFDFPVIGLVLHSRSLEKTAHFGPPSPIKEKKEKERPPCADDGYYLWTLIAQELARHYDGRVEGAGRDPSSSQ